jgi:hypothetical protein
LRWAKAQGAVTGYAHSGSGLEVHSQDASSRLFARFDTNNDRLLTPGESERALLPFPFGAMDSDRDQSLTLSELAAAHDQAATQLPNFAIPQMNGVGAMEICVSVAEGVCDFISAMDTPRIAEWNMWYHILNCGFPLKASGETDFPCMSGERVGQGRVYVQLGKPARLDFTEWCRNLARGRSYVSDGYAHVLGFTINDAAPGEHDIHIEKPATVRARAKVAFAPEVPDAVAYGTKMPPGGRRYVGDTVTLHGPRTRNTVRGGMRLVEIVVNSQVVATREVPADGRAHDLEFQIPIRQSSWVALRHFPQLHSNPINVLVANKPIRVSDADARWCIETIELLWRNRERSIAESERTEARAAFEAAIAKFQKIAEEASQAHADSK